MKQKRCHPTSKETSFKKKTKKLSLKPNKIQNNYYKLSLMQ